MFVFVYGTLKEGFPNFAKNQGRRLPGTFHTVERYPLYLVGERFSPWLVNSLGLGEQVLGQVFEVDQPTLATLDTLERICEPDGYRRVKLALKSVSGHDSEVIYAFAYLKQSASFSTAMVRTDALREYTLEHAALYQPRTYSQSNHATPHQTR